MRFYCVDYFFITIHLRRATFASVLVKMWSTCPIPSCVHQRNCFIYGSANSIFIMILNPFLLFSLALLDLNTITVGPGILDTDALHNVLSTAVPSECSAHPIKSRTDPISIIQCVHCFKEFRSQSALARHIRSCVCDSVVRTTCRSAVSSGRLRTRIGLSGKKAFQTCVVSPNSYPNFFHCFRANLLIPAKLSVDLV